MVSLLLCVFVRLLQAIVDQTHPRSNNVRPLPFAKELTVSAWHQHEHLIPRPERVGLRGTVVNMHLGFLVLHHMRLFARVGGWVMFGRMPASGLGTGGVLQT